MSCLPVFSSPQRRHLVAFEDGPGCLPVQVEQACVLTLEENVGEVLPQGQRGGIAEEPLSQHPLGATEFTGENEFPRDRVGQGGDALGDLVDDRRGKGPREISRRVGGEGDSSDKGECLTFQWQCRWFRDTLALGEETFELMPIGRDGDQLVARLSRGGR